MPTATQTKNAYELTFILGEKAQAEDAKSKATELKAAIEKLGGSVTKDEHWGRRDLAYPIKRNRTGFYVTTWFDLPNAGLPALERQLRFDEAVIRSLITKAYTTAQPGNLSPVIETEKGERERSPRDQEEKHSGEEMLRRHSTAAPAKKSAEPEETVDIIPEEERLKKLDETLDALLKDEE